MLSLSKPVMAPPHRCSVLLHAITKGQSGIAAVELLVGHLPEMHGGRMVFIVLLPGKLIPVDKMGWGGTAHTLIGPL